MKYYRFAYFTIANRDSSNKWNRGKKEDKNG